MTGTGSHGGSTGTAGVSAVALLVPVEEVAAAGGCQSLCHWNCSGRRTCQWRVPLYLVVLMMCLAS